MHVNVKWEKSKNPKGSIENLPDWVSTHHYSTYGIAVSEILFSWACLRQS